MKSMYRMASIYYLIMSIICAFAWLFTFHVPFLIIGVSTVILARVEELHHQLYVARRFKRR